MSASTTYGPRITEVARRIPTWLIYALGLVPLAWLVFAMFTGQLGIDPVKTLEHDLGILSLRFLLASLTITPLMRFGRVNLIKFRKVLGLLGFGYLTLHFLVWITLDLQFLWGQIGADLVKRPYIVVGFLAFLLLIPLAATSFQKAVRFLGPVLWQRIHRLVYPAVLLGAVHFVMQEKVWTTESIIYLTAAILLVGMRFLWIRRW